jgi:hypothetical protein
LAEGNTELRLAEISWRISGFWLAKPDVRHLLHIKDVGHSYGSGCDKKALHAELASFCVRQPA